MANNRLYIVDPDPESNINLDTGKTGTPFLLAKSMGEGWYVYCDDPAEFVDRLNKWFELRDTNASFQTIHGPTTLVLKTEGEI